MYYVYILQSIEDNSLYIGFTENLEKRLQDHDAGGSKASKAKSPYKLIFYEAFLNKMDALGREKYLKSGYGRRILKKTLANYFK